MHRVNEELHGSGEGRGRAVVREFLVTPEMHKAMLALVEGARPALSPRHGLGPWTAALWTLALLRRLAEGAGVGEMELRATLKTCSRRLGLGRQAKEAAWGAWALGSTAWREVGQRFSPPRERALGRCTKRLIS